MKIDIDCLKDLNPDQLSQLRDFISDLGYRKAAEHASKEFNRPIHKTALQRFIRRCAPAEFLEDTPDAEQATRQILQFAADGQPDFTEATLRVLEQTAFQLSFTCTVTDEDMNALQKVSAVLCRFRSTSAWPPSRKRNSNSSKR